MAEAIMKDLIERNTPVRRAIGAIGAIEVLSAGSMADEGAPLSEPADRALKEMGVRFAAPGARRLTKALVADADIVLTMERAHKAAVTALCPESCGKVFTLKEYAAAGAPGEDLSIDDPFGQPLFVYKATAKEIEQAARKALARIAAEYFLEGHR
jgi:protein-tyrosine-phosphatase